MNMNDFGFFEKEPASYHLTKRNLPSLWDYIYKNDRLLFGVDQNGPVKLQLDPPTGIMLFRREALQHYSSWLVWISSPRFKQGAFTNFFRPFAGSQSPDTQPDKYEVIYRPYEVEYLLEYQGIRSTTSFVLHPSKPAITMRLFIENLTNKPMPFNIMPVLRLYANPAQLAPWDQPEWYLRTSFFRHQKHGFLTQLMNMNAQPDLRRYMVLMSSDPKLEGFELYYEKFTGQGTFEKPEAVFKNALRSASSYDRKFGESADDNTAYCYPQINALHYCLNLRPGQKWDFSQVLSVLPNGPAGSLPNISELESTLGLLDTSAYEQSRLVNKTRYEDLFDLRSITTGDKRFDDYVNHWLPLQQDWICSLDRGWPSGMRGSRDSANDFTAMAPLYPAASRKILLHLFECQRTDGWFPRQYSALGRKGKHDLRGHVDAGCWIIELLYEYLCCTKDFAVLNEQLPWLDSDKLSTVFEHMLRAMEFFIKKENLGIHGLCKIGEGDWNDAVNLAGLKGLGESVMVSAQSIIALTQLLELFQILNHSDPLFQNFELSGLMETYIQAKKSLTANLRKHAFNSQGYFNSVFNDDGKWIFSPTDPDGQRRISGPANWYAIASGVADQQMTASILKQLEYLKCAQGYRLFYPPFGSQPIPNVGRIATGDQPVGVFENGTAYNQGSHGFLARALAVAGKGDILFDTIKYMLPYDPQIHPVNETLSAPYAVVNTWLLVPGYEGRGGRTFLTGSIAMALRAVYSWMLGIKPTLAGLTIDPCVPTCLEHIQAHFTYHGKKIQFEINNTHTGKNSCTLNGCSVLQSKNEPFSGRTVVEISDDLLLRSTRNSIIITI